MGTSEEFTKEYKLLCERFELLEEGFQQLIDSKQELDEAHNTIRKEYLALIEKIDILEEENTYLKDIRDKYFNLRNNKPRRKTTRTNMLIIFGLFCASLLVSLVSQYFLQIASVEDLYYSLIKLLTATVDFSKELIWMLVSTWYLLFLLILFIFRPLYYSIKAIVIFFRKLIIASNNPPSAKN